MGLSKEVLKKLGEVTGREYLLTDRESLITYAYDATGLSALPEAVIFPETEGQISRILLLANEYGFPVVPRGAGSGMSGGSIPVSGGLVLSLARFNQILRIDPENFYGVVQPGVITAQFQEAVEALGLFYPPDPSSLRFSTIGGNVAECAGGARAVKYGVTRDYVLGLTAVLPTGEILKTGVKTAKGVVGYDLTRLLVGSEGTLGVITEVTLKLIPLPECRQTLFAAFPKLEDASKSVGAILKAGIGPSTLEFMDQGAITAVEAYLQIGLPVEAGAVLLIEIDGDREPVERKTPACRELLESGGAGQVQTARSKEEAENLWLARRSISPALYRLRPNKINEDIVVPRSEIPRAISGFREIGSRYGVLVVSFGHAGDGNIHVNILFDAGIPGEEDRAREAVKEIFKLALELGGTLSGEHGIGLTKAPYLSMELNPLEQALMAKIKNLLDPRGILNPGKIITPASLPKCGITCNGT
jgi:glycolate oxidase